MGGLMKDQADVSGLTPMPTDRIDDSSVVNDVSAETITFSTVNSGVWTASGSHAVVAGDIVAGKTAYSGILNSLKHNLGHFNDTSFSFDSGTGLTTQVAKPLEHVMSEMLTMTPTEQAAQLLLVLPTAGQYFIDHRRGMIFGNSADTTGSQPASYSYATPIQVAGTSPVSGGNGIFAEDAAHASGDKGMHVLAVRDDALAAKAGTNGDYASLSIDDLGYLYARLRGYDTSSNANKGFETAPIWSQHVEETLADVTNETSATNYYYVDLDGYNAWSIQADTGGTGPTDTVTITLEGSNQDDGTAAASCFYTDISKMAYDAATNAVGTASWVDVDMMAFLTPAIASTFKYVRVKTVTAGGNNDQDYTLYSKKAYV